MTPRKIECPRCHQIDSVSVLCWVFANTGQTAAVAGDNAHPPGDEPCLLATCECGYYFKPPHGWVWTFQDGRVVEIRI